MHRDPLGKYQANNRLTSKLNHTCPAVALAVRPLGGRGTLVRVQI